MVVARDLLQHHLAVGRHQAAPGAAVLVLQQAREGVGAAATPRADGPGEAELAAEAEALRVRAHLQPVVTDQAECGHCVSSKLFIIVLALPEPREVARRQFQRLGQLAQVHADGGLLVRAVGDDFVNHARLLELQVRRLRPGLRRERVDHAAQGVDAEDEVPHAAAQDLHGPGLQALVGEHVLLGHEEDVEGQDDPRARHHRAERHSVMMLQRNGLEGIQQRPGARRAEHVVDELVGLQQEVQRHRVQDQLGRRGGVDEPYRAHVEQHEGDGQPQEGDGQHQHDAASAHGPDLQPALPGDDVGMGTPGKDHGHG
mmetsp:Transcript_92116/g.287184  ORF Transcript_92116/g.287184 Transcript_92116/m.287184 type:complete len:314 (+) Transcript_92116:388-1329(+)